MLFLVSLLLQLSETLRGSSCREAGVMAPAAQATIMETAPLLQWNAIPGVEAYRLEIESRVSEGRAVVSLDTQVSGTSLSTAAHPHRLRARSSRCE